MGSIAERKQIKAIRSKIQALTKTLSWIQMTAKLNWLQMYMEHSRNTCNFYILNKITSVQHSQI
jgi:hypothetical protein